LELASAVLSCVAGLLAGPFLGEVKAAQAVGVTESSARLECALPGSQTPVPDPLSFLGDCLDASISMDSLDFFEVDFDFDGARELFVGSSLTRGNGGEEYHVFKPCLGVHRYLGDIVLHPSTFRVLPPGPGRRPEILLYQRAGCCAGDLVTMTYSDGRFVALRRERIEPNGKDEERFAGLFDTPIASVPVSVARENAISGAEAFIRSQGIDLSGQTFRTIRLSYDVHSPKPGHFWRLVWNWTYPRLGGEFGLRVYLDGTAVSEVAGP